MCWCAQGGKKCQGAECWGDIPLASVTFDTGVISLPRQLFLPLPVANRSRSARKLILNEPTMQLPVGIVEYLNSHATYKTWLTAEAVSQED